MVILSLKLNQFFVAIFVVACVFSSTVAATSITTSGLFFDDIETKTTRIEQLFQRDQLDKISMALLENLTTSKFGENIHPIVVSRNDGNMTMLKRQMIRMAKKRPDQSFIAIETQISPTTTMANCQGSILNFKFQPPTKQNNPNESIEEIEEVQFYINFKILKQNQLNWLVKCGDGGENVVAEHFENFENFDNESKWSMLKIDSKCLQYRSICLESNLKDLLEIQNSNSFLIVVFQRQNHNDWLDQMEEQDRNAPVLPFVDSDQARGHQFARRLFKRDAPSHSAIGGYQIYCQRRILVINFNDIDLNLVCIELFFSI